MACRASDVNQWGMYVRLLNRVVLCAALVAGSVAATAAPIGAAPAAPFTFWSIQGPGVSVATSDITASMSSNDLFFAATTSANHVGGQIVAENSGVLAIGTYPLGNGPSDSHAWVGLDACYSETSGTLTITQVDISGTTLVDFAASYSAVCSNGTFGGEIRWQSDTDFQGATTSTQAIDFATQDVGYASAPHTVTITGVGSTPTNIGTPTISGTNASEFTISADTCAGIALASGQTCSLSLVAKLDSQQDRTASLSIPEDGIAGASVIPLHGYGNWTGRGTYAAVAPTRILDTRKGIGAAKKPLGAGGVLHLQVGGTYIENGPEIPTIGVAAVVLTLTVTGPTTSSYLTAYPTGSARPTASSINFVKGWTGANTITVPVNAAGKVDIYNAYGSTQIIADVIGYYGGPGDVYGMIGGAYHPLTKAERMFDSRSDGGPLPAGYYMTLWQDFGAVNAHITAFAANVTATGATATGYLTAWNGFNGIPTASVVNFGKGSTVADNAIIPAAMCDQVLKYDLPKGCGNQPSISIYNGQGAGKVNFIIDVVGYYTDATVSGGEHFTPIAPRRILDSRSGMGPIGAAKQAAVTAPAGLLDAQSDAISINLTAVSPTASTYLSLWPTGGTQPAVSAINPAARQTVANGAIVQLGTSNRISVYNRAGSTNVLIDVSGVFDLFPYVQDGAGWIVPGAKSGAQPNTQAAPTGPQGSGWSQPTAFRR